MNAKVIWHSDNSRKRGSVRIVLVHEPSAAAGRPAPVSFRIEERIRDNALGEETWIPFDNERLPAWTIALISEFVYQRKGEKDEMDAHVN